MKELIDAVETLITARTAAAEIVAKEGRRRGAQGDHLGREACRRTWAKIALTRQPLIDAYETLIEFAAYDHNRPHNRPTA